MNICVLGWYGTETIGDRAILAGLIHFFNETFDAYELQLGSLNPFFSRRTFTEDQHLYGSQPQLSLFDSTDSKQLDAAIQKADWVVIGGGPLMHINPMYMLAYAFKRAKSKNKKTMVLGCGVGPMHKKKHFGALQSIIQYADAVIYRDAKSLKYLENIGLKTYQEKTKIAIDPAVKIADYFLKNKSITKEEKIVLNLREFPQEYSQNNVNVEEKLVQNVQSLIDTKLPVHAIPMHYFHIGNDDRDYFNFLKLKYDLNFDVQNVPLTLEETMQVFSDAKLCVGMRFHAVVLQSILNGNNFVLDYTEPQKGKISGFLEVLESQSFYQNRYLNLQESNAVQFDYLKTEKNEVNPNLLNSFFQIYLDTFSDFK